MAEFEPIEAAALERSHGIETSAVVADVLMTTTLVYVYARVASCRERISVVTNTLKTTVQVRTFAISTYSISLVTLVHVCVSIRFSLNCFELFEHNSGKRNDLPTHSLAVDPSLYPSGH